MAEYIPWNSQRLEVWRQKHASGEVVDLERRHLGLRGEQHEVDLHRRAHAHSDAAADVHTPSAGRRPRARDPAGA